MAASCGHLTTMPPHLEESDMYKELFKHLDSRGLVGTFKLKRSKQNRFTWKSAKLKPTSLALQGLCHQDAETVAKDDRNESDQTQQSAWHLEAGRQRTNEEKNIQADRMFANKKGWLYLMVTDTYLGLNNIQMHIFMYFCYLGNLRNASGSLELSRRNHGKPIYLEYLWNNME